MKILTVRFCTAVITVNPETESFFGVHFTVAIVGTAAGAINHFFGTSGLRTEVGGFCQGTVSAHTTVKEDFFSQMLKESINTTGEFAVEGFQADFLCNWKQKTFFAKYLFVNKIVAGEEKGQVTFPWRLRIAVIEIPGAGFRKVNFFL